jgi:hypothetical protein
VKEGEDAEEGSSLIDMAFPLGPVEELVRSKGRHERRVTPTERAEHRRTALQEAVSRGHIDIVRLLLDKADVNAPGQFGKTPLKSAIERDDYGTMQLLLRNGARPC